MTDSVLDAKLETEFSEGCVRHTCYTQGFTAHERRVRFRETWNTGKVLGQGTFGFVRVETCRPLTAGHLEPDSAAAPARQRAVKVIRKKIPGHEDWDYLRELEAIVKFSHQRFAPYFVRSDGWFESRNHLFITLEYFPLGDLQSFMKRLPPFTEESTQQIIQQLLEGMAIMHDSGFAHRDLKPANILVEASSPQWLVKIADFGISKRAQEGGTDLRTLQIGTFGYMAPEVLGFFSGNDQAVAYSVTVDIWAIGIIAYELLFKKHPFINVKQMLDYVNGTVPLLTSETREESYTADCQDFLRKLLSPNPVLRPTAGAANNHPWLGSKIADTPADDSLFVPQSPQTPFQASHVVATPASLAWTTTQLGGNTMDTSTGTLLPTYQGHALDTSILIPNFRHIKLENTRYFVLRSTNETDIETSIAHSTWTSSPRVNKMLNKAYLRSGGRVVLFFSVTKSRKFCGVAQMTSEMDWENTDEHWLEDVWQGRFSCNWLSLQEVSFDLVKHVPVKPTTPGFRAISCYDGTEIAASSAFELFRAFTSHGIGSTDEQLAHHLQQQEWADTNLQPPPALQSVGPAQPVLSTEDAVLQAQFERNVRQFQHEQQAAHDQQVAEATARLLERPMPRGEVGLPQ